MVNLALILRIESQNELIHTRYLYQTILDVKSLQILELKIRNQVIENHFPKIKKSF